MLYLCFLLNDKTKKCKNFCVYSRWRSLTSFLALRLSLEVILRCCCSSDLDVFLFYQLLPPSLWMIHLCGSDVLWDSILNLHASRGATELNSDSWHLIPRWVKKLLFFSANIKNSVTVFSHASCHVSILLLCFLTSSRLFYSVIRCISLGCVDSSSTRSSHLSSSFVGLIFSSVFFRSFWIVSISL